MSRPAQPLNLIEIGPRLKATREALGLSQEQAADETATTGTTWSKWETAERTPAVGSMLRLRAVFGVPLDWIYAGDPARLPHDLAEKLKRSVVWPSA